MADDRTKSGTPLAELPEVTGKLRQPPSGRQAMAVRLVPTVDKIRQIQTRFGLTPYRVFLVHLQWPGRVGDGAPQELSRRELLPNPSITDMGSTSEVLRSVGLTEEGTVRVDQISAKYTEDDLMGRTPDLVDPTMTRTNLRNVEFFWEVVEDRPSDPKSVPRRYVPSAVPTLNRGKFQWSVTLTKQDQNRPRNLSNNPLARRDQ